VKRLVAAFVAGLLAGVVALLAVRVALVPVPQPPHFHANVAIVIDGRRVDLSAARYMEELGACHTEGPRAPEARVHLHNGNPDVVHVHADGVTWGHLLANLGFGLGDSHLATDTGRLYASGDGRTLTFILNGTAVSSVANRPIHSGDRLLIGVGPEDAETVIRTQFPMVASTAEAFNHRPDPAGCSGPSVPTLWERIRQAVVG
jgi:hypothetical protein